MREIAVFHSAQDSFDAWSAALQQALPDLTVLRAEEITDRSAVRYAVTWHPPQGFYAAFPKLELIVNLGAGVDAVLGRSDLPAGVAVTRLADPGMKRMMSGYVLFAVLRHARDIPMFERATSWLTPPLVNPETKRVGILGLGELGSHAVLECVRFGFEVSGWSRSARTLPGVRSLTGDAGLERIVAESDILVSMLPLNDSTRNLIDADLLARLPMGAAFVNASRGRVVDEDALIAALRSGRVGSATLDVFAHEPLADDSPFWTMDNVLITPHIASSVFPQTAASQVVENIQQIREGAPIARRVNGGTVASRDNVLARP